MRPLIGVLLLAACTPSKTGSSPAVPDDTAPVDSGDAVDTDADTDADTGTDTDTDTDTAPPECPDGTEAKPYLTLSGNQIFLMFPREEVGTAFFDEGCYYR